MNYKTLFTDKDTLYGENFTCTRISGGACPLWGREVKYPALFVLSGLLTLVGEGREYVFSSGSLVIVDRNRFSEVFCLPNTIILEYTLPDALTSRFGAFEEPVTPPIPITGRLETWVEDRLLQKKSRMCCEADELVNVLILYQHRRLQQQIGALRDYGAERGFLRRINKPESKLNRCVR